MQLETLGNVLTCGLVIVALIVVPVKLWRVWWPVVMSKLQGSAGPIEPVAGALRATPENEVQPFAKPCTPVNEVLSDRNVAQSPIPESAREIIVFWTRIEDCERIIAGGKVGMVEAIELIFSCKRNGRPDSVYGRARAALQAREAPRYLHPLTDEQKTLREELELK